MRHFEWYNLKMCLMYGEVVENRGLVKNTQNMFFVLYLLISPTKSTFCLRKSFWWYKPMRKK